MKLMSPSARSMKSSRVRVGDFGLDHPELGQMAAGFRFLRAKGWPEGVHLAQRHRRGFDIKLAGLRQKRLLVEIIDRKQRGGAFAGGGREDRRIGQGEAAVVKEVARRLDDLRAHAQDRCLARRAHPQMAVLHQEVSAVLFRSDGIRIGFGHALHDLHDG